MALSRAGLIVDTTSTSGTGNYTLDNPAAPGGGFRNLANAVTDGDPNNADTIYYWVLDTTTEGAVLAYEHGIGTVSGGGTTLARTSVLKSSNSNNAVDWAVGGSRTVRFGIGVEELGLLGAANTWTAAQTFSAGATISGGDLNIGSSSALSFGSATGDRMRLFSTTYGLAINNLEFTIYKPAGAAVRVRESPTGTVTGTLAYTGVLSAPSGTRLLLGNASLPTGWAIVSGLADKTILTTSTVSEIDDVSGSWTISGLTASTTVNGTTLTEAQIPSHSHSAAAIGGSPAFVISGSGGVFASPGAGSDWLTTSLTTSTGGGGSHTHTASTTVSSAGSWRPAYYKAGWIEKS